MSFYFLLGVAETLVEINDNKSLVEVKKLVKGIKEANEFSFLRDLPNEYAKHSITLNGKEIKTGSILIRPIREIELLKLEYHYAIVLGTDKSNNELFLEMTTSPYNIRVATMEKFLTKDYTQEDVSIYFKANAISQYSIIEKAKEIRFEEYSFFDLNCKQFVEYVIFDIEPTKYSKEIKNSIATVINVIKQTRFPNK